MATSAPSSASRDAIACPSPRPDPVTSATCPFSENSLSAIRSPLHPAERLQIADAFPQLRQLVLDDGWRRLLLLPGCPVIGIIIQTLRLEPIEDRAKLGSRPRRIAFPPVRRKQPDVPHVQRANLDRGGHRPRCRRDGAGNLLERHAAIADRAANETKSFARELGDVVL